MLLINYSIFCFHEILFGSIVTLFLSSPQNAGGLDFTTDQIGFCLAVLGIYNSLFQITMFRKIERKWGSTKMIRCAMIALIGLYLLFPVNAWIAKTKTVGAVTWVVLALQALISPFAWSGSSEFFFHLLCNNCMMVSMLRHFIDGCDASLFLWRRQRDNAVICCRSTNTHTNGRLITICIILREEHFRYAPNVKDEIFSLLKCSLLGGNFVYYVGAVTALIGYIASGYL